MDVFEKVQQTKPEIEDEDMLLGSARARLMREIAAEKPLARTRKIRRPWIVAGGLVGAAVAVVVGVLVVSGLAMPAPIVEAVPTREPARPFTPTPSPAPMDATPSEVLQGAAAAAAGFIAPPLEPGQFLRREWTQEEMYVYEDAFGSWATPGYGGARSTATSGWLVRVSGTQYIPADLASPWYDEIGPAQLVTSFGDPLEVDAGAQVLPGQLSSGRPLGPGEVLAPWAVDAGSDLGAFFSAMPREPAEMLTWIRDHVQPDRPGEEDFKVGLVLIELLGHNAGPPDVRATMYRALSLLPGSTVGSEQAGARTVTFDSRIGSSSDTSLTRITVTIDMVTGEVRETTHTSDVGEGVIPAGVPDFRLTYTSSVVDALP